MNNLFKFKKFDILQNTSVFKVGTDSVLLGCLANIHEARSLVDIGTGTGILSLICSQRNPSLQITAIDCEEKAYLLAKENFNNSPFSQNITIIHSDIFCFRPDSNFDYIICNPPYFKISEQLHLKHPVARHQIKLNYSVLIEKSKNLLAEKGKIGLIFPIENKEEILELSKKHNLFPERIIHILGIKNGKIKRVFLELSHQEKKVVLKKFFVEESPRVWSDDYKELTKNFYL